MVRSAVLQVAETRQCAHYNRLRFFVEFSRSERVAPLLQKGCFMNHVTSGYFASSVAVLSAVLCTYRVNVLFL